jgi:hypothetical protein
MAGLLELNTLLALGDRHSQAQGQWHLIRKERRGIVQSAIATQTAGHAQSRSGIQQ